MGGRRIANPKGPRAGTAKPQAGIGQSHALLAGGDLEREQGEIPQSPNPLIPAMHFTGAVRFPTRSRP
jgi:hypothetical protein